MTNLPPLAGTLVALSISESPDLAELGLLPMHLDHAFLELSRQLLAAGADLAYGGDLRRRGFTERLSDLLHTYPNNDRPDTDRVREYLAWPLRAETLGADEQDRLAALTNVATVVPAGPPPEPTVPIPDDLQERWQDACSFTLMRERMTAECDARIVLGGRLTGFQGRFPGVAEEALLTAAAGKPLYVVGGFGGCARALAGLIRGDRPEQLDVDALRSRDEDYARLLSLLPGTDDRITEPLAGRGPGGLGNGLSGPENEALFATADIDEVVALVLRGLRAVTRDEQA